MRRIKAHRKISNREFSSILSFMENRPSSERLDFVQNLGFSSGRPFKPNLKVLAVLGSGGHTTEMMYLLQSLQRNSISEISYVLAETDKTSQDRMDTYERKICEEQNVEPRHKFYRIPRSREVGQSYFSSIFTTLYSFLFAAQIVYQLVGVVFG